MKDEKNPAAAIFMEETITDPRKKEAARRIVELAGELHLSIAELDRVMKYIRKYAGPVWIG